MTKTAHQPRGFAKGLKNGCAHGFPASADDILACISAIDAGALVKSPVVTVAVVILRRRFANTKLTGSTDYRSEARNGYLEASKSTFKIIIVDLI